MEEGVSEVSPLDLFALNYAFLSTEPEIILFTLLIIISPFMDEFHSF